MTAVTLQNDRGRLNIWSGQVKKSGGSLATTRPVVAKKNKRSAKEAKGKSRGKPQAKEKKAKGTSQ
jgi:hypothetical protein